MAGKKEMAHGHKNNNSESTLQLTHPSRYVVSTADDYFLTLSLRRRIMMIARLLLCYCMHTRKQHICEPQLDEFNYIALKSPCRTFHFWYRYALTFYVFPTSTLHYIFRIEVFVCFCPSVAISRTCGIILHLWNQISKYPNIRWIIKILLRCFSMFFCFLSHMITKSLNSSKPFNAAPIKRILIGIKVIRNYQQQLNCLLLQLSTRKRNQNHVHNRCDSHPASFN